MKPLMTCASAAVALAAGQALSTDYAQPRTLRIETTTNFSMETTAFSMERDGEPVDNSRFGGGGSSTEERHVVQIDEVLESKEGAPTHVRRTFEALSAKGTSTRGENEAEFETECPLAEVTLDLVVDEGGDVVITVAEGTEPDDEALLEGHELALDLDALLPDGEVEVGDEWELDSDKVRRALGTHVQAALFPRPQRQEGEGGSGEGERGGRGRGGFGSRSGSAARLLGLGEWKGKATLASLSADHEGAACAEIAFELECEGEMPEPEFGGGRGGRGGFYELALAAGFAPSGARFENEFSIDLEGRLLFALEEKRPALLEFEGSLETDSTMEREGRDGGSMRISTSQAGKFTHVVTIAPGSKD